MYVLENILDNKMAFVCILKIFGMKMSVFYGIAPCSSEDVCWRFRGACETARHQRPDDEGIKHLRNIGKLLLDFTGMLYRVALQKMTEVS